MRVTLGAASLGLTAVLALVIFKQRQEIASLRTAITAVTNKLAEIPGQLEASKTKVVTHGLEILSDKGNVVAAIRPMGEGVQVQLQSFSESSTQSSNVYLFAEDGVGAAITLSKNKDTKAAHGDAWATYGTDGYYVQSGVGFDEEHPDVSARLRVRGDSALQMLYVHDGQLSEHTELGHGHTRQDYLAGNRARAFIALDDGKTKINGGQVMPATFSLTSMKNAGTLESGIMMNAPAEDEPGPYASFTSWNQSEYAYIAFDKFLLNNRDGFPIFVGGANDDNGSLALYDRKGTLRVGAGTNKSNNGSISIWGPGKGSLLVPTIDSPDAK